MSYDDDTDYGDASAVIVLFLFAVYGFVIGAAVVGLVWWLT